MNGFVDEATQLEKALLLGNELLMNDFSIDDSQIIDQPGAQQRPDSGWLAATIGILIGLFLATAPFWIIASNESATTLSRVGANQHRTPKVASNSGASGRQKPPTRTFPGGN